MNNTTTGVPISTDTEVLDRNSKVSRSTIKAIGLAVGLAAAIIIIFANRHAQNNDAGPVDPQPRPQAGQ